MNDSEKYIGAVFDGRYKLERTVGIGGMAFVYEATDMTYNKKVAVKLLKDKFSDDTRAVKRFINESKSLELLSHPNIVKIFDISVNTPHKYIVMEYINGITLRKYMNYKLPLEWREAVEFTEQILLALDHAHTKGVIHRDIKPQNIMIMQGGKIRVTDFGIAKIPKSESLTLVDKAIGTVYYISPEQASSRKIDARSDIYSLGVMLYEMVTGKLPFTADTPIAVIFKHINDSPVPPSKLNPAIPRGLEQIILCAMEKNPQNRYQSAAQMLRHLRRLKLDPNTVFLQPKPAPRTPTSETVLKRTARAHRDTSEFDFVLNEGNNGAQQPQQTQAQRPQQTQAQRPQQTQAQRPQQPQAQRPQQTQAQRPQQPQAQRPQQPQAQRPQQPQAQRPQQTQAQRPQQTQAQRPQQTQAQRPQQTQAQRPQQTQAQRPQQPQAQRPQQPQAQRPQQTQAQRPQQTQAQQPQNQSRQGHYYRYQNPNPNISNRTIPLSQMHKPASNQVLMEEERARRMRMQEAQKRPAQSTARASQPQARQQQTRPASAQRQPARTQQPQRKNTRNTTVNSSSLLLIVLILLIAIVCVLLLFVTIFDVSTAPSIPSFMQNTADAHISALLYLKQVIL